MYKHWNKHTKRCSGNFQHLPSQFCWLPVAWKLYNRHDFVTRRSSCVGQFVLYWALCFYLSGYISSQKGRIWSDKKNPDALHDKHLHSSKSVFGVQRLENGLWDHFLLGDWGGEMFSTLSVTKYCLLYFWNFLKKINGLQ